MNKSKPTWEVSPMGWVDVQQFGDGPIPVESQIGPQSPHGQARKRRIFVFGSNEGGIHGAGSARAAFENHGAKWGHGVGLHGDSYAIPTKDQNLRVLPLERIKAYILDFLCFADAHRYMEFNVVKIGCGLAGFKEEEIAPLFRCAPENVILPDGWRKDSR